MPGSNGNGLNPELNITEKSGATLVSKSEAALKYPFYQKQAFQRRTFDRDAKLAEMYGTLASRRDLRRFEKYWNSDQRLADEKAFNEAEDQRLLAHEDAESKKYMASVDLWIAGMNDRAKAAGAATLTPVLTPVLSQVPVVLTPKPTTDWNARARQYGFADMEAVRLWQQANGLEVDGKFGKDSKAKFDELKSWSDRMTGLGYKAAKTKSGIDVFIDGKGNTYFNNGRMMSKDNKMSDYNIQEPNQVTLLLKQSNVSRFNNELRLQWVDAMTTLNYKQLDLKDGSIAFQDPHGNIYYDTGRMKNGESGGIFGNKDRGKMFDYDLNTFIEKARERKNPKPQGVFTKAMLNTAFAENPAIMMASGYKREADGSVYLTEEELKANEGLRNNLAVIGLTGLGVTSAGVASALAAPAAGSSTMPAVVLTTSRAIPHAVRALPEATSKVAGYLPYKWTDQFGNVLSILRKGGTMNKINYFQQGGVAPQQDMQQQIVALVQAAMLGDQKATQTVNQIMEKAKAGDQQAMQIAQMIQQVAQKMTTSAKWGAKLGYIRSLKYAHGGKTCPSCDKGTKVKVAYKDIDKETYKKLPTDKQHAASMHAEQYASEYNKNGTYKTVHKPTAEDSTTIDKKHLSVNMKKNYTDKKECGGKAKKHYFGGWL